MTNYNKIEELKYLLGFDFYFATDRDRKGGGIAFLWRKSINCVIFNYSLNHVDVEANDPCHGK